MRTVIACVLVVAAAHGIAFGVPSAAQAADDVHIWIRGFIPDSPSTPRMLQASDGGCIATDHRSWSEAVEAPARLSSDFHLVLGDSVPAIRSDRHKITMAAPVHQVDCQSLQEIALAQSQLLADIVGTPAQNQAKTQVSILAAIPDPQRDWSSSTVGYDATFTYDRATQMLEYRATTGFFPAYEAYATLNDGPVVTVFRSGPSQSNKSTAGQSAGGSSVALQGSVNLSAKRPKAPTNLRIE